MVVLGFDVNSWSSIFTIITSIIFLIGIPYGWFIWVNKRLYSHASEMIGVHSGFIETPLSNAVAAGQVNAAFVLKITHTKQRYFQGELFYGETEYVHDDNIQEQKFINRSIGVSRVVGKLSWLSIFSRKNNKGELYLVDNGTTGYEFDRTNAILWYEFENRLWEESILLTLGYLNREPSSQSYPKSVKIIRHGHGYLSPYETIKQMVFITHPNLPLP